MEAARKKTALITGICGQDGYFLTRLLLRKGYKVIGIFRTSSTDRGRTLNELTKEEFLQLELVQGDIIDSEFINNIIRDKKPDEIYHLAGYTFVQSSFKCPLMTFCTNIFGTRNILSAVQNYSPSSKIYCAGTSEQFGNAKASKQNESTEFNPCSPYAISKVTAYYMSQIYRKQFGLFVCVGLLFNHESEVRAPHFVTRKITLSVAKIKEGLLTHFELGNLNAKRDWGYAGDYVDAMWAMLQQEKADDYVIATGETHSVREFVEEAFKVIGVQIEWRGTGENEKGIDSKTQTVRVVVNDENYRPLEVDTLTGDYQKAKEILKWAPQKTFKELVELMVQSDLKRVNTKSEDLSLNTLV